ncbi:MAG TPA: hypothetical protein VFD84_11075 [Candidatus Binatia bacterium]|nr:hypothetical protein [Candidatus Binatia bacterium]
MRLSTVTVLDVWRSGVVFRPHPERAVRALLLAGAAGFVARAGRARGRRAGAADGHGRRTAAGGGTPERARSTSARPGSGAHAAALPAVDRAFVLQAGESAQMEEALGAAALPRTADARGAR